MEAVGSFDMFLVVAGLINESEEVKNIFLPLLESWVAYKTSLQVSLKLFGIKIKCY